MKKILVIDDEKCVRDAMRLALSSHDYSILEADTGDKGLELAVAERPDLILSDINMAGMSGLTVLERLRAHPATASASVILMTGVPQQVTARCSMERGADDYLVKPFDVDALLGAVKARLERQELLQAEVKATEARLLGLLSATRDLVALVNPQTGALLHLNSAGRRMLEIPDEAPIAELRLAEVLLDMPDATVGERLAGVQRDGVWIGESEIITKTGRRIPVSGQIMAHQPDGSSPAYVSVVARDITEQKRAEALLEETHAKLIEASRQAGMAETANAVLHNVGNVLNSINSATECVAESLRKSDARWLSNVVTLFQQHQSDLAVFLTSDSKGIRIPAYLAQLADRLEAQQQAALQELGRLQKGVEHIKCIVRIQQNLATGSNFQETFRVSDVVADALAISCLDRASDPVEVIQEIDQTLELKADKHKVLQILINLLSNARQACAAGSEKEKRITICCTGGPEQIAIAVTDTGVGIPPENLGRVFTYRFTTKRAGHGFGLYSSSIAAKELGGVLSVQSPGSRKGATFTLELPRLSAL